MHRFSICSIIRLEIRWRTRADCKGLHKYKKLIERDEEIVEEIQDGNKSDRGTESQDS